MATARPFAYNTSGTIDGTTQVGDLSVGVPTSGFTNSPQYWNGPNEELGYVIAIPYGGDNHPTPIMISAPTKYLTLSGVYIGNDIAVINGGQTATQQFGYQQSVLANAQIDPSSKVMFSVLFNTDSPSTLPGSHYIGIGKDTMNYKSNPPYGAYPGSDNVSMGYCSDGTIVYNGSVYGSGLLSWTENDVIDIVINNNVSAMWVRVNGGDWNNNPSDNPDTNAGGFEIIGGPFYPVLCPGYQGAMTIQNSAEYGVPSGYILLGSNETSSVGFFRSTDLTDGSFIDLTNSLFNQSFTTASDASTWLTNNGYWNSFGTNVTDWYLYDVYNQASNNGEITFPDHAIGSGDLNPNNVGQAYGGTQTQLYINTNDASGVSHNTEFSQLVGVYGNLTLTQSGSGKSVTYSFTNDAFQISSSEIYSDYEYESAIPNSLCVTSFASGDFNTTDPISISYSAYPSNYTFTIDSSMLDGLASIGNPQYASANGTDGFTVSTQINNLWNGVYGTLNDTTEINTAFTAAGATESYPGYIALAQWGDGSDYQSGLAKVAFNSGSGQFFVTSVDGTDSNFTETNNNSGSNLVGTFNFPATFTIITPLINKTDWC